MDKAGHLGYARENPLQDDSNPLFPPCSFILFFLAVTIRPLGLLVGCELIALAGPFHLILTVPQLLAPWGRVNDRGRNEFDLISSLGPGIHFHKKILLNPGDKKKKKIRVMKANRLTTFERTRKMSLELNCSQQLFLAKWQRQWLPEAIFASQVLIDLLDDC